MENENQLITIYKASNQIEAEIVKARLESEGIPALLKYESLGSVYGFTVDGLAQVEVQVPLKCAQAAEKLVNDSPEDWDVEQPGRSDG